MLHKLGIFFIIIGFAKLLLSVYMIQKTTKEI